MKDLNDATEAGHRLAELLSAADATDAIGVKAREGAICEQSLRLLDAIIAELHEIRIAEETSATRAERTAATLAKLYEESALLGLAVLNATKPLDLQPKLFGLSSVGVSQREIGALRKAVAVAEEQQAKNANASSLQVLLRDLDPKLRLECPPNWVVDRQGIWTEERRVTAAPLVIRDLAKNLDTGVVRWTLAWLHQGTWCTRAVDRGVGCDSRAIVGALGSEGAPVGSHNAGEVVKFLAEFESWNQTKLKPRTCTSRLGWHGDRFVSGPAPDLDVELLQADPAAWRSSGTREGWLSGWQIAQEHPLAVLALYLACAAPLLRFLDLGYCPVFDIYGPSGRGKTTCALFGMSAFGVPRLEDSKGIGGSWGGTATGREERLASLWDVPVLLDDTNMMAGRDAGRLVGEALYQLHRGRTRDRATAYQVPRRWRTVVISTGEKPAATATEQGGAKNRVLSIDGSRALPSRDVARAIEAAVRADFGHLGADVARAALEHKDDLVRWHRKAEDAWAVSVQADSRLLASAALVTVVARLLHGTIGLPRPAGDPLADDGLLHQALVASAAEADQAGNALDLVREELAANGAWYLRRGDNRRTDDMLVKWRGVWGTTMDGWVGILPSVVRELLAGRGHDVETVLQRWGEDGTLMPGTWRRLVQIRHDGRPYKVYAFRVDRVT